MARGKVKPDEACKLASLSLRLTWEERQALDARAKAEGLRPSDLARRALAGILTQPAAPLSK